MQIREIYEPKGIRYTIYRGEKPGAFQDSGIPMGTDIPRKAFMRGVPSKLITHIMNKLEAQVPSEKFYTEIEEGDQNSDDWSDEELKDLSVDMQKMAKRLKVNYKKLNKQRARHGLEPVYPGIDKQS